MVDAADLFRPPISIGASLTYVGYYTLLRHKSVNQLSKTVNPVLTVATAGFRSPHPLSK